MAKRVAPPLIDAGRLNRRVSIQQQTTAQDSYGQPVQTWTNVYTCWASIDIQHSSLIYETSTFIEKVIYRITLRWTSSVVIQPNDRIQYTEGTTGTVHTYNIESLLNMQQRNRELVAMCYELDGNAQ